ncbi:AAA family ATPase [Priestia megaterium]|uniref:AAA family ATPase n=1 Tax=Priestia megaterium TaxID=1404 RepID=UPI001C227C1D|nr:AAA family ATPase [Priestia megaterium]MBU8852745.1 ATP-binding protein [Bacillus sp. FJAT-26377]MCU7738861.1 ATP-binding protein [Priestia megaterium]
MELNYIWLEDYLLMGEKGLNFSDRLLFSYNKDTNILSCTLNKSYIPNFFVLDEFKNIQKSNVNNITAIIGQNGAGKSTILHFIKNNLVNGAGGIKHKGIIIFNDPNTHYIYIYHHSNIIITIDETAFSTCNIKENDYDVITYEEKVHKIITSHSEIDEFRNTTFVFFSNIYDGSFEEEFGQLYNISTNYLINADKIKVNEISSNNKEESVTVIHKQEEIKRQLFFIKEFKKEILPFELPNYLSISPNIIKFPNDNFKKYRFNNYIRRYNKIFEEKIALCENHKDRLLLEFYQAAFNNIFYEAENFSEDLNSRIRRVLLIIGDENEYLLEDDTRFRQEIKEDVIQKVKMFFGILAKYSPKIKNMIKVLESLERRVIHNGAYYYGINIDVDNEAIYDFLNYYTESRYFNDYLNFNWRQLSSGETAFLNTYSRFHSVSKKELQDNVIILIDEGEVYLHPYWQKIFLKNMIKFLITLFENKNIQIIITSNSPFIVSDLPPSNIIFLKKSENKVEVLEQFSQQSTFASNIHSLLSNSFFLNDGLIGEFAKNKINNILEKIYSSQEISEPELIEYKKFISLIGEPVIREQLYKILYSHLEKDLKQKEILALERRLNLLKRQKND